MKKLSLLAVAGLLVAPAAADAKTLDELLAEKGVVSMEHGDGSVHYKGGSRLDFGEDFDMKVKIYVQPRFEHTDNDTEGRRDAGVGDGSPDNDTSGFRLRRLRVQFSGNLMNDEWSYMLYHDFASGNGGSALQDGWLQWNMSDAAKIRFGQFKTPFSRQESASSAKLQFPSRSIANDFFVINGDNRNQGVMLHGETNGLMYAANVFNGESDGEGRSRRAADNNLAATAHVAYNIGDYGSRGHEGDIEGTEGFAMTVGGAVKFGSGETAAEGDFDDIDLNGDIGMRAGGWSGQGEVYYASRDFDDISGDAGEREDIGFYFQTGYFFVPQEWEVAGRFGYISFDDDVDTRDDQTEYTLGVNYYLWKHALHLQNSVSFVQTQLRDAGPAGDDWTDFRYIMQLTGNF